MRISQRWARRLLILAPAALIVLLAGCSDPQTTIEPRSDMTEAIQGVYEIVFWLSMFVFVAIMLLTLWLAVRFRERPGQVANQIHGHTRLEILWTIIPVAIVLIMLVPTWQVIADTTDTPPENSMVVEAEGKQWWFEFRYPEFGIVTANELHIQAGRPVHVKLYAEDVIHSFWIPQLAGKVDMVPGHENDLWFTPNEDSAREEAYLGQCVEFCGTSHANMRFRVFVHDEAGFAAWAANEAADAVEPTSERQGAVPGLGVRGLPQRARPHRRRRPRARPHARRQPPDDRVGHPRQHLQQPREVDPQPRPHEAGHHRRGRQPLHARVRGRDVGRGHPGNRPVPQGTEVT